MSSWDQKKAKNKKANLNKSRQRIEKEHRNFFKETLQPIFSKVSSGYNNVFIISYQAFDEAFWSSKNKAKALELRKQVSQASIMLV